MQRVYQQSLDTDIDSMPDHQKALDGITAISAVQRRSHSSVIGT